MTFQYRNFGNTTNVKNMHQVCLNYNPVTPPSIIKKVSFADSNSIFQTNNYIPLRLPISLTNLGNTCYLNSVLQILFQVNTVVPFDIWINHLLLVDKIQCTNSLPLLAFYNNTNVKNMHLHSFYTCANFQQSQKVS